MEDKVPGCTVPGTLIVRPGTMTALDKFAQFSDSEINVSLPPHRVVINSQGIYQIVIANCDNEKSVFFVEGNIEFRSSTGFLPGHEYGFLLVKLWRWF